MLLLLLSSTGDHHPDHFLHFSLSPPFTPSSRFKRLIEQIRVNRPLLLHWSHPSPVSVEKKLSPFHSPPFDHLHLELPFFLSHAKFTYTRHHYTCFWCNSILCTFYLHTHLDTVVNTVHVLTWQSYGLAWFTWLFIEDSTV